MAIITEKTLDDQGDLPDLPPGLPSQLMERRPDILQAEAMVAAQTARIGVAQAMRLPSFNLLGVLGVAATDPSQLFTSDALIATAMAQITGPVFNFGKNKRRVEVERFRTEQTLYAYQNTVIRAMAEVEDALVAVQTYKDEYEATVYQRDAAANANRLSKERYDRGVTSFLEVLESERYLFNSEIRTSQTRQLQLNSMVMLYKALGGGWDAVRSPLPEQDKESIDYEKED